MDNIKVAEDRFKIISEAYHCLIDSTKRSTYDRYSGNSKPSAPAAQPQQPKPKPFTDPQANKQESGEPGFRTKFTFDDGNKYEFNTSHTNQEIPKTKKAPFKVNRNPKKEDMKFQKSEPFSDFFNLHQENEWETFREEEPKGSSRFVPGKDRYGKGIPDFIYERPQTRDAKIKMTRGSFFHPHLGGGIIFAEVNIIPNQKFYIRRSSVEMPKFSSTQDFDNLYDQDDYIGKSTTTKMPFGRQPFAHHHNSKPHTFNDLNDLESGWKNDFIPSRSTFTHENKNVFCS